MGIKGTSIDISDANEGQVFGNWRKGNTCDKVANDLAELCSSILQKIEIVISEIGYLAKQISKQNIEGVDWFFLTAQSNT